MTVNATMEKFGFPDTLIQDYGHWVILARPAQVTLGSLVLVCKDDAAAFSAITPEAFAELAQVTRDIETTLSAFRAYDKINYLMLMMVDPDVHFHVLPRYAATQQFGGVDFPDVGWPAVPDLATAVTLDDDLRTKLIAQIGEKWLRS